MSKNNTEITMDVVQEYGNLSDRIRFNKISWNGATPKYDIRNWYVDKEGNLKFAKGITLTDDEVKKLYEILNTIVKE